MVRSVLGRITAPNVQAGNGEGGKGTKKTEAEAPVFSFPRPFPCPALVRRPRRLEAKPLAEANEWLEMYRKFWEARFHRLDSVLDDLKAKSKRRR